MSGDGLRHTPLRSRHIDLGAKLVPFAGWEMPIQYPSGIVAEHRAVRSGAGLFDLSHMGELVLRGDGALAAADRLISSDIAGLDVGQARYGLLCNERGTIVDDVIAYRVAADEVLIVVNASNADKDATHVQAHLPPGVEFADRSLATALIAVQGPRAERLLDPLFAPGDARAGLAALPAFGVTEGQVGPTAVTIARTGYTGEDGFEVFLPWAEAGAVWDRLYAAGGLPIGLGARDTLRLEARFSLYGNEIDETTDPIEAGLGWACRLEKDFIGRDAIARVKQRGPQRRIAGLTTEQGVPRHGHPVIHAGETVGQVTSGTHGPTIGRSIALAYLPTSLGKVGTEVAVRIRDREVPATVVRTPFYRRPGGPAATPTPAKEGS